MYVNKSDVGDLFLVPLCPKWQVAGSVNDDLPSLNHRLGQANLNQVPGGWARSLRGKPPA